MKRGKVGRGELTGKRVGKIAGTILRRLKALKIPEGTGLYADVKGKPAVFVCYVDDVEALAGTSLTQRPDRKAVAKKPKGKP